MEFYIGSYNDNFGYLIKKNGREIGRVKWNTGEEVDEIKGIVLSDICKDIQKRFIVREIALNEPISIFYQDNNFTDYVMGVNRSFKTQKHLMSLLDKSKKDLKEIQEKYDLKIFRGENTSEHKNILKLFKSDYLNNPEFASTRDYDLNKDALSVEEHTNTAAKISKSETNKNVSENNEEVVIKDKKKKKKKKKKSKVKSFDEMTQEERDVFIQNQKRLRKVVAQKYIETDLSKYREVKLNRNTIPNVINEKVSSISIYTDGSMYEKENKKGKYFKKGYGIIIADDDKKKVLFKMRGRIAEEGQIINDIELVELYAIYRATYFVKTRIDTGFFDKDVKINIHTDSLNTVKKFNNISDEKITTEQLIYNDLWDYIFDLEKQNMLNLKWVKGHSNSVLNRGADILAKQGSETSKNQEEIVMFTILREMEDLMEATQHINPKSRGLKLK